MRTGVLVTRPEPGLGETMAAVASLGFEPIACPLLRIISLAPELPPIAGLAGMIITSSQAIPGLDVIPALRGITLFAVGDVTAARARACGFSDTRSASGNAQDLAALIRASLPAGARLLLATGSGQGAALARTLRASGYRVHRRVLYRSIPREALPPGAAAALLSDQIEACLFFSAATALTFGRVCPILRHSHPGSVRALAISPAVGAALTFLPWLRIEIAAHPDAASLLSLLRSPS